MNRSVYKLVSSGVLAAALALNVETLRAEQTCTHAKIECELNDGHEFRFMDCGVQVAVYGCFWEFPGEPEWSDTCIQDPLTFCS